MILDELNNIANLLKKDYESKKEEYELYRKKMCEKYNVEDWVERFLNSEEKTTYQGLFNQECESRRKYESFTQREWKEM